MNTHEIATDTIVVSIMMICIVIGLLFIPTNNAKEAQSDAITDKVMKKQVGYIYGYDVEDGISIDDIEVVVSAQNYFLQEPRLIYICGTEISDVANTVSFADFDEDVKSITTNWYNQFKNRYGYTGNIYDEKFKITYSINFPYKVKSGKIEIDESLIDSAYPVYALHIKMRKQDFNDLAEYESEDTEEYYKCWAGGYLIRKDGVVVE